MRRARLATLLAALVTVLAACGDDADGQRRAASPWSTADVGPHEVLEAPRGVAPRGVVLVVHEGGWLATGPEAVAGVRSEAVRLAGYGWRAVNIDHRPGGASVGDVVAWYDRVHRRWPRLPVCVFGRSAGAHLALMVASRRPVRCVIGQGAPTDLRLPPTATDEERRLHAELVVPSFGDRLAENSPVTLASRIRARTLLATSAADATTPCRHLTAFRRVRPATTTVCLPAGPATYIHAGVSPAALRAEHRRERALLDAAARPARAPEARVAAAPARTAAAPVRSRGSEPRVEVLTRGLTVPWDIAFLPDGRALVTERPGRIRLLSARGRQIRVAGRVAVSAQGEGGLLGIAVDPDFARGKRFVYVYATTASGMQVQRLRLQGSTLRRSGVVLGGIRAGSIHDSGRLAFGPDKRLYVLTGDAGQGELAQRDGSLNGRVLRLSPAQFRSRTSRPTVVSKGHRNPQGLDWQPGSGRLFTTEHGPSGFDGPSSDDEVNVIRRGANYGWPRVRGADHGRFAAPAWVWSATVAPSGANFVSRGGSAWTGDLLVATLRGQRLIRLDVDGNEVTAEHPLLAGTYGRLRAVVEAPDGTFWITTSNRDGRGSPAGDDDRILRLVPPAG
ncbi:PQQ-dependent sugar dehydrogenase [Conexibacter sp. SYSU D00693]|uniref:PQQ-dependent sugar dehydrogenase n=1 Tax=Conexibacter sp. SYSU D00693 TaxID=2812560 RepID=UPI00196B217F|nr:PQQ-dependent sugar dehydrogenase [Conexibacter sp. SYSU D00693]